jgi:hypothetical protein
MPCEDRQRPWQARKAVNETKKRIWSTTWRSIVVLAVFVVVTQEPASWPAGAAASQVWVVTTGTVRTLSAGAPRISARLFGSSQAVVLGFPDNGHPRALSWADESVFEEWIRKDWIPKTVTTVMYDPENWPSTPPGERDDPVGAMRAFSTIARAHGWRVVLTPSPSLVTVPGGVCTVAPNESIESAYVRCDIAGQAAMLADVVETQAQHLETDPFAYRSFVAATAEQARAANPNILVVSGLSTNFTESPVVLYSAWRSVRDLVDGHYLAIPKGIRPELAVAFLRLLPR